MRSCVARVSVVRNIAAILLLSAALWAALFTFASAEVIRSFNADIVVNSDSSFVVTETIVYDFEGAQRHGIYRNIKDTHPQQATAWYKKRHVDITLISVTKDGQSERYSLESYNGLSVKIGDPQTYVYDEHVYQITYLVEGGLAQYGDEVELYWDVTGDEWDAVIQNTSATVRTVWDGGLATDADCYVGKAGSTQRCITSRDTPEVAGFRWNQNLSAEQVTIAQQLKFQGEIMVRESLNYTPILPVVTLLWFIGVGVWLYRWRTKYRKSMAIIPQYEPLPGFKPMLTGVLFDKVLDSRDITAGIVYLAQQGYLKIKHTTEKVIFFKTDEYEITLKKAVPRSDSSFDDEITALLFGYAQAQGGSVKLSDLKKDKKRLLENHTIVQNLKSAVSDEIYKQGFTERGDTKTLVILIGVSILLVGLNALLQVILLEIAVLVAVAMIIGIVGYGYSRRTAKGYEARNYLMGFKDYLATTEKERYRFHNAPTLNAEQFMEYLPYAIAFGVEKQWAQVFENIKIVPPDWYQGNNPTQFNTVAFANGVSSFSTILSNSTGTSPSSGGGRAGGGGGGGGGGSW